MKKTNQVFNKSEIINLINPLKIYEGFNKDGDSRLITEYNGYIQAMTKVSKKYQQFDFKTVVGNVLPAVEQHFLPTKYSLYIGRGYQELKLSSDKYTINGDIFQKQASIVSSSNKMRRLNSFLSLMREVCTNGMMGEYKGNNVNTLHLNGNIDAAIAQIYTMFQNTSDIFQEQKQFFETLTETISYRKLIDHLFPVVVDDKGISSIKDNLQLDAFNKIILDSPSDTLIRELSSTQIQMLIKDSTTLRDASDFNFKRFENVDIQMPQYKAFNLLVEPYKKENSAKLFNINKEIAQTVQFEELFV